MISSFGRGFDSLQLHDKKEAANFERLLFLHNLLASIDLEELVHH